MSATRGAGRSVGVLVGVALAVLELLWFAWDLREPLPNAGRGVTRLWILSYALPEVVPGVSVAGSHLGRVAIELSRVEFLPQRLPIVLVSAGIALAAVGLGRLVLRGLGLDRVLSWAERLPLAFMLGLTGLSLLTLLLGRLGALGPWPIRLGLGVVALVGCWRRGGAPSTVDRERTRVGWGWIGFGLVVAPFLLLMALASMLPTIDFDSLEYHLQGPKESFQAGRVSFLPHNVYTSMPFGVEMLHLLAMVVAGDWWRGALSGQFLVMLHAPVGAAFVAMAATRLGSPRAGWVGGIVYLSTPWIYRLAAIPYVEGPLIAYHAGLIWLAARAWGEPSLAVAWRLWGVAGALAGGALACKYPGLVSAVVPFGGLALGAGVRRRSWRVPLAFVAGLALVAGPWLAKNVVDTGNPVYPLGWRVFGGRGWDAAREAKWVNVHGPRGVSLEALGGGLVDVAGRSDWQSPLFVALAPLAWLRAGSRRPVGALWGYAAYLFATWWLLTHRLDRFWLPMLAPLAVLAGLGADWTRRRGWTWLLAGVLAAGVLVGFTYDTTALAGLNDWTEDLVTLRKSVPELLSPPLARLDAELPPGARILLVGQAAVFHLNHPIVYNTVFDDEILEGMAKGRASAEVREALARRGVTFVYVDWAEIARYRSPGNYGYTPFVTPELFAGLVRDKVLGPARHWGPRQDLYRVLPPR